MRTEARFPPSGSLGSEEQLLLRLLHRDAPCTTAELRLDAWVLHAEREVPIEGLRGKVVVIYVANCSVVLPHLSVGCLHAERVSDPVSHLHRVTSSKLML